MVSVRGEDLASQRTTFTSAAPYLTNIAITLQRMGGEFRSKGLELFERLLVLSVYDAQIALQALDHRPLQIPRLQVRRRIRRHKQS